MDWNLPTLLSALRYSLQSPRDAIRQVIASDPPMTARWIALLLVAIVSTFLMLLSLSLVPPEDLHPALLRSMDSPLSLAALHLAMLVLSAQLLFRLGRFRNGRGSFADSLTVLIWFQIIMLLIYISKFYGFAHGKRSCIWLLHTCDHFEKSCLTGTIRSYNAHNPSRRKGKS
jgi:hypothetical protein